MNLITSPELHAQRASLRQPLSQRLGLELEDVRQSVERVANDARDRLAFAIHDQSIFTSDERHAAGDLVDKLLAVIDDADNLMALVGYPHQPEEATL